MGRGSGGQLKPTVFSVKFLFEKNEKKQKEAGVGPLFQKVVKMVFTVAHLGY